MQRPLKMMTPQPQQRQRGGQVLGDYNIDNDYTMMSICCGLSDGKYKMEEISPKTSSLLMNALNQTNFSSAESSFVVSSTVTDDTENWRRHPPQDWTCHDVIDWIYHVAEIHQADFSTLRGENFHLDGLALCRLTEEDFLTRENHFGQLLYKCLQDLLKDYSPMEKWQRTPAIDWSNADVLDWIYFGSGLSDIDLSSLKGERFQGLNGKTLCYMNRSEFIEKDAEFGNLIYNSLHQLLAAASESKSSFENSKQISSSSSFVDSSTSSNMLLYVDDPLYKKPVEDHHHHHHQHQQHQQQQHQLPFINISNEWSLTENGCSDSVLQPCSQFKQPILLPGHDDNRVEPRRRRNRKWSIDSKQQQQQQPRKQSRKNNVMSSQISSSSTLDEDSDDDDDDDQTMTKTPKHASKMRLWMFMRDLLDNPKYNPECIRWENKEEGIFRIVSGRSKIIAELWGKIKNNPTMTFDKLGRSLRWCRANNGKFSSIPKDGKFPRKLCFRLLPTEPDSAANVGGDLKSTSFPVKPTKSYSKTKQTSSRNVKIEKRLSVD